MAHTLGFYKIHILSFLKNMLINNNNKKPSHLKICRLERVVHAYLSLVLL